MQSRLLLAQIVVTFAFLLPLPALSYFKCASEDGSVAYQEQPCPDTSIQSEKKLRYQIEPTQEQDNFKESSETSAQPTVQDQSFQSENKPSRMQAPILLSRLSAALGSVSSIKLIVLQHYLENGRWPNQLSDIGLQSDQMSSSQINGIDLGADGTIVAELNEEFGTNKKLALVPSEVLGGTNVEWKCFANFDNSLLKHGGSKMCESRKIN